MSIKKIQVLQNTIKGETPTIRITSLDPEWEKARDTWIMGKNPTSSPEWKIGVISFSETIEVKEPSLWDANYWHTGHNVYDFFMKKYSCSKCKKERTAALCKTCIFNISKAEEEKSKVIDVLALTVQDEVLKKDCLGFNPKMYQALYDAYGDMTRTLLQIDKLFDLLRKVSKDHGGSLHEMKGCSECLSEKLKWLNDIYPDWKNKTTSPGCCSLCIERSYEFLINHKEDTKEPSKKVVKDAPEAVTL